MVYKFFDKKSSGSGVINEPNYQLANELHKSIIRKFRDNIWGVDLADMQSLSKYNKGNKYLLCAIDLSHLLYLTNKQLLLIYSLM